MNNKSQINIAIIGAGITGLSSAYYLSKQGYNVTIFERSNVPGGLGTYIPIGNTYIERYYHHFFESDILIKQFAEELGIADKLLFYQSKTSIFINKKLFPFNSPKDLLLFTPLSYIQRITCGITIGFLKLLPKPFLFMDRISAKKWIKKYAGNQVYKNLWGPLLEGKFSQYSSKVPIMWLWGRVYDRSFKLGYFTGSVKVFFDKLILEIKKRKGKLFLNVEITSIKSKSGKVIISDKSKEYKFDKVILTTVSPIVEQLCKDSFSQQYRNKLSKIDHLGAVCVILELKQSVQSNYWVNICEPNMPVLVMVEHTQMVPIEQYNGKHIVYLANYIHRSNKRFRMTDEEVVAEYITVLKKINSKFDNSWIIKAHVSRVPRAQTIFQTGYLNNIPSMKTEMENVYLANIDQMYPHDRNLNQGIELGLKVATIILNET